MRRSRLLVVSQSKVEQLALSRQLARASFRVDTAANVDDAEAFLQSVRYRAVLIDLDDGMSIDRLLRLRERADTRMYALCKATPTFCAGGCEALDGVFHHPLQMDAFVLMLRAQTDPIGLDGACEKAAYKPTPKLRLLMS